MTRFWCEHAVVGGGSGSVVSASVDIEVVDGRFVAITTSSPPAPGAIRLAGLTVPGLANAHSHAFHRALRGRTQAGRGSFWSWRELMYRVARNLDPDSYHALARAAFAEMMAAGITCVGEFHYVHHRPDGRPYDDANAMGHAVLAAAADVGVRITLLDTMYLHGGWADGQPVPLDDTQRRFGDGTAEQWAERVDSLDGGATQRVGAAIHSMRAVGPREAAAVAAWADERGAVVHAHVSEQPAENEQVCAAHGQTPVQLLEAAGALGHRFTAVHATHLTDRDVDLLGSSTVCMCPTTERDLGDGIGPTSELVAAGARLAVGSDSHAVVDVLEEVRSIELHERLRTGTRGVHSATSLLDAASVDGHRSLGWHDAGRIAVGDRADLVSIALDSVRTAGCPPTIETAVFAASAGDVTDVVVDGVIRVAEGRHVDIDTPRALAASIAEVVA